MELAAIPMFHHWDTEYIGHVLSNHLEGDSGPSKNPHHHQGTGWRHNKPCSPVFWPSLAVNELIFGLLSSSNMTLLWMTAPPRWSSFAEAKSISIRYANFGWCKCCHVCVTKNIRAKSIFLKWSDIWGHIGNFKLFFSIFHEAGNVGRTEKGLGRWTIVRLGHVVSPSMFWGMGHGNLLCWLLSNVLCKVESCCCKLSYGTMAVSELAAAAGGKDVDLPPKSMTVMVMVTKFMAFICNVICCCGWRLIDGHHILLL